MIDWTEAPLVKRLGVDGQAKFNLVSVGPKTEWFEDTMSPRQTTLGAAYTAGGSTITVATGTGQYFKIGDVLKIDNELMYVSGVNGDTVTVVTGYAGTTNANHSNGATVILATVARLEGADYTTGHTTTVENPFNYTQILEEAVKVSGSQAKNPEYVADTMSRHIAKLIGGGEGVGSKGKAGKLVILLEQTFFYGRRTAGNDTSSRAMGGFNQYVTTNITNLSGAALTRRHIEDAMQACYVAGGSPDLLICGAWAKRKISGFYEKYITKTQSEKRGGAFIETMVTDFGEIEIMYDRWCPEGELYIVEADRMGWVTFRPFQVIDRPALGDYEVKEVLGEYTFVLTNEKAHAKIMNFSTTS
jgi:hypothetical protein